jgi:sugar phosphate permease
VSTATAQPASAGAPARVVITALVVTLVTQMLTAMSLIAPAVIAPLAAEDLGLPTERIGIFVALNYGIAMISGLLGAASIARFGALATCQISAATVGIGLAIGGLGQAIAILAAASFIGVGYGLINPASSHILVRVAPPRMLALILSIKQTGVPIGGALAGAIMPSLALWLGWRGAIEVLAAASVGFAVACVVVRKVFAPFDGKSEGGTRGSVLASVSASILLVVRSPRLLQLAMASLAYSGMQIILFTYLVAYLKIELGYAIVTAGLVYSAAQIAGIAGRIFWGAFSDRLRRPRRLLGLLGIATFVLACLLATFGARWSATTMTLFCVLLGSIAIGWNGVHFAEVARNAPAGAVGQATGGTQFFTFMGALGGPALFGALVSATGQYGVGFALFAVAPLALGISLLARPR